METNAKMGKRSSQKLTFEEACSVLGTDPSEARGMGFWRRWSLIRTATDISEYGTRSTNPTEIRDMFGGGLTPVVTR